MAFGNWEMQAGDPTVFAFRLAFLPGPDGDDDRAPREERASWGAFSVWAHGENLCAHIEQGEVLDSARWYMLPLIEWLAATAAEHGITLATRDRRAAQTYRALDIDFELID